MSEVDPGVMQWREIFSESVQADFARQQVILVEIRDLVQRQNARVRANELTLVGKAAAVDVHKNAVAIAGMKTWVTVVAVVGGVASSVGAILAWVMR